MGNHKQEIHSDLAIPPREYLEEIIAQAGRITPEQKELWGFLVDDGIITSEIAIRLRKATGVPAHIWIGLEEEYRLTLYKSADNLLGTCRHLTQVDANLTES